MGNYLTSASTPEKHARVKPATRSTNDRGRPSIKLQDLPEDVLSTILSKLPAEEDLENMLCSCCKLERLGLVRCHLNDELRVTQPLSHLQYLQVICCRITKIEFLAAKLSTFVYDGFCIPFALHHASKLENAKISFIGAILQHAAESLLNGLPNVQNLTLQLALQRLETRWMLNCPRMFSQLRHVQLMLIIPYGDTDKILYLVSFLRAVPLIEKLEVHFHGIPTLWFANDGPLRQEIPSCEYTHLNNIHVMGFRAARGQVEFLLHVLENAPAVQVVTLDTGIFVKKDHLPQ
ncbi:hypothetical protein ACQ4PT_007896 [Festuca glaucescens]